MLPKKIILATANANKAREFQDLLPGMRVEPKPAGFKLPEETGNTFEDNARLKARALREWYLQTASLADGKPPWVMADDSGIEVSALAGGPGIYSSRYAGEQATDVENVSKLLADLSGNPDRSARFVCVIVCYSPEGLEYIAEGELKGVIAAEPHGEFGFGYDPVFIPENYSTTVSELAGEEKNRISHRARAAQSLLSQLGDGR
ncbi:MAG: RdgB/HAM1 family non-canonical purine NTP pyrophosphatase [Thermoleophilia bacterium]|nr:RdgB/HAM1 family non-canonical purine NTP pyrophosphatase [Thermoleophilia bacterium]